MTCPQCYAFMVGSSLPGILLRTTVWTCPCCRFEIYKAKAVTLTEEDI